MTDKSRLQQNSWHIVLEVLALIAVVLSFFSIRALKLDQFVVQDENLWFSFSANFYTALAQGDLASTFQKEHPGVPVMWAGTAAFLLEYPGYRLSNLGQAELVQISDYFNKYDKSAPLRILRAARMIVLIGATLAILLAYLCARRLFGLLPAFLGFILIAFDPFYIGLTRVLHLDGLWSTLFFLSLLAFISYLKDRRLADLTISGIAAGFCWLTRSMGFFLVILAGLLALGAMWQNRPSAPDRFSARTLWRYLGPLLGWGAIGALIYFVFWPAMWVAPVATLRDVILLAMDYAEMGHSSAVFFNGALIANGKLGADYYYFYPTTFLWRTTPVVIAGLIAFGWAFICHKKPFNDRGRRLAVLALLLSVLLFTIFMTTSLKKFDRYFLPAHLPLDLLAGLGWASLGYWLWEKKPPILFRSSAVVFLGAALAVQMGLALSAYPYYFNYYNPLLGGPRKALQVMQVGWGEGLDQAARYLNEKPDAAKLNVFSWFSRGSFSYFFEGTARELGPDVVAGDAAWAKLMKSDYVVIYISQRQRQFSSDVLEFLDQMTPEHTIWLDGLEYAQIYKLR